MSLTQESPVRLVPVVAGPVTHPTLCPPWCKDRGQPGAHHFGPTATWHWGPQHWLTNPHPLTNDEPIVLRAELFRADEDASTGETRLYVSGETDLDMSADEADAFITQAQAFVDVLRVLRRQMG